MGGFATAKLDLMRSFQEFSVPDTKCLNECKQLSHEALRDEIRHAFSKGTNIDKGARKHQIQAVQMLVEEFRKIPPSRPINYLLQHSTGSGKSLTIASLVHQMRTLSYIRTENQSLIRHRCFGAIIVLNDRIQLDRQLGKTVSDFLQSAARGEPRGLGQVGVVPVSSAEELREALAHLPSAQDVHLPATVIISTLQKFPSLQRQQAQSAVCGANGGEVQRVCVVADEAHRSHGGGGTALLHEALGGCAEQPASVTYVAFTATPDPKALKLFGVKRRIRASEDFPDDSYTPPCHHQLCEDTLHESPMVTIYEPWHCYSMEQALQDGNILNVLKNYSTVCPCIQMFGGKNDADDSCSQLDVRVDQLLELATTHRDVVKSKAQYIAEHLAGTLAECRRSGYTEARAMLVARSRQHVVWYCHEIRKCLEALDNNNNSTALKVYAAFSGAVGLADQHEGEDRGLPSLSVSESEINANVCQVHEAHLLIVCNKYETGYDDPRLGIMYVDKPLQAAKAVQTLSRLNRPAPHLQKKSTVVVDFVNSAGSIAESFEGFYRVTRLREGDSKHAERRQRELQLDRVLSRILTTLAFAARVFSGQEGLAAALSATPKRLAAMTRRLLPEFQCAFVEDVSTYCGLCERLRREKPELPYHYACALRASLQACVPTPKGTGFDHDTTRQVDKSQDTSTSGSLFSINKESMLGVKVSALEETFAGEIVVGRWTLPLFSRRMHTANASHHRAGNGSVRETPVAAMSLSDAIHSANNQLKDSFGRKALAGLQSVCKRLDAAAWGDQSVNGEVPRGTPEGNKVPDNTDVGMALSMLHRLEAWRFSADLLSSSGTGAVVNRLRKHPCTKLSSKASMLVKLWRRQVENELRTQEEIRVQNQQKRAETHAKEESDVGSIRNKAVSMLAEAIRGDAAADVEYHIINKIAAQIEKHVYSKHAKTAGKDYRATMRSLSFNLRESWKNSGDVLALRVARGAITPEALVLMDQRDLAPDSIKRALEEREAKQRKLEDEEKTKAELAIKNAPACTQCGERTVSLHSMTNGGTYAQERELIQKAECFSCGHKWRL